MKNYTNEQVQKIFIENILCERKYGGVRQFFNDHLLEQNASIQLTNASKEVIDHKLQEILTILKSENHHEIIDFLELNTSAQDSDEEMQ